MQELAVCGTDSVLDEGAIPLASQALDRAVGAGFVSERPPRRADVEETVDVDGNGGGSAGIRQGEEAKHLSGRLGLDRLRRLRNAGRDPGQGNGLLATLPHVLC